MFAARLGKLEILIVSGYPGLPGRQKDPIPTPALPLKGRETWPRGAIASQGRAVERC